MSKEVSKFCVIDKGSLNTHRRRGMHTVRLSHTHIYSRAVTHANAVIEYSAESKHSPVNISSVTSIA